MTGDPIASPGSVPASREPRPREVTLVSILLMAFGGLGALLTFFLIGLIASEDDGDGLTYGLLTVSILLALAQIASGVFVFLGREWARKLAMGLCALNAVSALFTIGSGQIFQVILPIVINIAIIVQLTKPPVAEWMR